MIKGFISFLDRHRFLTYLVAFLAVTIGTGRFMDSTIGHLSVELHMWGRMLAMMAGVGAVVVCKILLDNPKVQESPAPEAVSGHGKQKRAGALGQASDPRYAGAFEQEAPEAQAPKPVIGPDEDRLSFRDKWKLYWRAKRALRKRKSQ